LFCEQKAIAYINEATEPMYLLKSLLCHS